MPKATVKAHLGAALALAAGLCLWAACAAAQSAVCQQIAAELAALPSGGGAAQARQAAQARAQLGQVQSRMAALGCNRGFVLFGPPPPPECGGLRAQAGALQGRIAQADAAAGGDGGGRRMRLMASYDANNCRAPSGPRQRMVVAPQGEPQAAPVQREPGMTFLEALFGRRDAPRYATPEDLGAPPMTPEDERRKEAEAARRVRYGGSLPICVRTCDGFFFPINYRGAEEQHEDLCAASCPGAETRVYWMSAGADLETAASGEGSRYTALPTAFSYRKSYDPACSCKAPQQTWGSVLQKAEALIREKGTITVTDETSLQMARPTPPGRGLRGVKEPAPQAEPARPDPAAPRFVEAGVERSGVAVDEERPGIRVVAPGRGAVRPPQPPPPAPPPLR